MSDFLKNLKIGDLVVVDHSYGNIRLSTVSQANAAFIWVGDIQFSRASGYARGVNFAQRHFLRQPTPEMVAKIKRADAIDKLRHTDFADVPTEKLLAAVEALGI